MSVANVPVYDDNVEAIPTSDNGISISFATVHLDDNASSTPILLF